MKKLVAIILSLFYFLPAFASHIAGGELFYEYIGRFGSKDRYKLTMRLFRDCNSQGQQLDAETVMVGIYRKNSAQRVMTVELVKESISTIQMNTGAIPCLIGAPDVCFQVGIFTNSTIDLDPTADGYILSWVRCCRSDNIANLSQATGAGATFVTNIPGTSILPTGNNSSPQFFVKDTALVCQNKNFTLDFGAFDPDGDSLSYSFCSAYTGGTQQNPNPGNTGAGLPNTLNLVTLSYQFPYSGNSPLGGAVSINPNTGKITGTAPPSGRYVVNVCVNEWRNGVLLNEHRKDFILAVGDCDYAGASPLPLTSASYIYSPPFPYNWVGCTSATIDFVNTSASTIIKTYSWDFGVPGITTDTSSKATPSYTFPDTGMYNVKLVVRGSAGCVDSAIVPVGIYPGFKAGFDVTGACYKNPFNFIDTSTTKYGFINTRIWDFGDLTSNNDTSSIRNPSYTYPSPGTRKATFIVTNSKGCIDTVERDIVVSPGPPLNLPFRDTLICSIDTLQLLANGVGTFQWSPNVNISNVNVANPYVSPKDTMFYVVTLTAANCSTVDSIRVKVVDSVRVSAGNDTTICMGDAITFNTTGNALQYNWSPAAFITGDPNIKFPNPTPDIYNPQRKDTTITYNVIAKIGKCQSSDAVKVHAVRYPVATADLLINVCTGDTAQLSGKIQGATFSWTPKSYLINANTLTPLATPQQTIRYTLTVFDTVGCPKPDTATTVVRVVPPIAVNAGNDTSVLVDHLFVLNATGTGTFAWTPTIGMQNSNVPNPAVVLTTAYDSITYKVTLTSPEGCIGTDDVKIRVFTGGPTIYVPSAFTPDGDGKNDIFRPFPVGIKQLNYFKVYNRMGQLVYFTSQIGAGWDGKYQGVPQTTGTYVYMAEALDYVGRKIFKKGTAVLIR